MKYLLVALLVIHGLIHLLGFVKAFELAQPAQLQAPITRPLGILWLSAALLLIISGAMCLVEARWWWLPATLGVILSQLLISSAWGDAKAGTVANILLLVPIVVAALAVAPWNFRALYAQEVAAGFQQPVPQPTLLTEADMSHLPPVVQRYLTFVGAVGKPQVWNYHVRFRGALRNGPNDRWMPVVVEQQSFVNPPVRLFLVEATMFGIPFAAFHRYVGPQATFQVKVASLLTVVDAKGAEMNQSETVTLLNDMFLLAPATLIDPQIQWAELDPLTVRATWTNAGHTVSAVVSFDPSGALVNFVSDDRYRTADGKQYEQLRWSTPVRAWREADGRKLFSAGEAIWQLPTGEFAYGRFDFAEVEYNVPAR